MRLVERARCAWAAWNQPPSATWYVVEDLQPLGWRVVHEETSYDRAASWSVQNMPQGTNRIRVLRADLWEMRTLAHMRSDLPWFQLGKMAAASNRWREHEYEVGLLAAVRGTERDPLRTTGSIPVQPAIAPAESPHPPTSTVLPVQHGTGWPVDAPTTPVPGLSVENDPEHVGSRLERARRRARHVRWDEGQDGESVGGE